ncbi:DUF4352 domain-containing protein [Candidatus Woesearchaeota archaeon]|nr:DUF4352 domain-containing protein [Candidatus Woesearchaeota archaeon]
MKKIYLILILLILITGCKSSSVVTSVKVVEESKPIIIGIDIIEKSVHNYIVGAEAEGKYLAFNVEVANAGAGAFDITKGDIELKDKEGNRYFIDETVSYYREDRFSEVTIQPNGDVSLRLVFDVPDPNKDFTLIIKGKSVKVE